MRIPKAWQPCWLATPWILLLLCSAPSYAQVGGVPIDDAVLIRVTATSEFSPASPDPSGIAYFEPFGTLLISDGEVNEIAQLFTGDNLFETSLSGQLVATSSTLEFSDEPTGVAYDPATHRLFFTDDTSGSWVWELDAGSDGAFGTADDNVNGFRSSLFGSLDPEGIAIDPSSGHLFVIDGNAREVFEIDPGPNGVFEGSGDDTITQFDTSSLAVIDPEGIEYFAATDTLFLLSKTNDLIAETTREGTLIRYIDIQSVNPVAAAGLTLAPASSGSSAIHGYIVDRGIDNGANPNENDGRLLEISFPLQSTPVGPPTANFNATPTTGLAPLNVQFNDLSDGAESWLWEFGDNTSSTLRDPNHIYDSVGSYTVSLTVSNAAGQDTIVRSNLISITGVGAALTFGCSADAQIKSSNHSTNYGALTTLRLRGGSPAYDSLLKFDVSGLSAAPSQVLLRMFVTDGSNDGGSVVVTSSSWNESQLTWGNAPARTGTVLASAGAVSAGEWVEFDVSAAVPGNGIYSFGVMSNSTTSAFYSSREGSQPPELVVTTNSEGDPPPPPPPPPLPPVAAFGGTTTTGVAPLAVQFSDLSSGSPTSWLWSFGDGSQSTSQNPTHTYVSGGSFTVSLSVSNSAGSDVVVVTDYIEVTLPPQGGTTVVIPVVDDARAKSTKSGSNYGASTTIRARQGSASHRSFLRFEVAGVTSQILSAVVRLVVTDASDSGGALRVSSENSASGGAWSEGTLTWSNSPSFSDQVLDTAGAVSVGQVVDFDVTAVVSGSGTYSFALTSDSSNSVFYSSKEGNDAPQLILGLAPQQP